METQSIAIPSHESDISQTGKKIVIGAAGGITQVLIGQPFDIVKVRMQTQGSKNALVSTANIWTHEGPLAFYKGSAAPFLGVGLCISIVFASFHTYSCMLETTYANGNQSAGQALSPSQIYLAGGMAGLTNSIISGPLEHVRIRLQTQPSNGQRLYSGTRDCTMKILRQAGVAGLYRGQVPTMLREFHSYGIWFSVYEFLLGKVMQIENKHRDEIESWKVASCGALAGEILWAANHPIDVVKSKMQADGFGSGRKYRNMRDVCWQTWRSDGIRGFFRGLSPTLLRAMPVSAGTFAVVEAVRKALN